MVEFLGKYATLTANTLSLGYKMIFQHLQLAKTFELDKLFIPERTILHIPHDSYLIPPEYLEHFIFTKEEIETEQLKMTDHLTSKLFILEGGEKIIFPVSRLLLDPERFLDDAQESMSLKGMGVIYTHSSDGAVMKKTLSQYERQALIDRFYIPHHQKLEDACTLRLEKFGEAIIIDCHSFPEAPLPYEDPSLRRPEICIGFDEYHASKELVLSVTRYFKNLGFDVGVNEPFAGSLVPSTFYLKDSRVQSIMIEVRRDVYLKGL